MKISFKTNFLFFSIALVNNAINSAEQEPELTVAENLKYDPKIIEKTKIISWQKIGKKDEEEQNKIFKKMTEEVNDIVKNTPGLSYNQFGAIVNKLSALISQYYHQNYLEFFRHIKEFQDKYKNKKLTQLLLTIIAKNEIDKVTHDKNIKNYIEKIIMQLISEGADISKIKYALPHAVARQFSSEYIKFLIANGADTNYVSAWGPPLIFALNSGNLDLIKDFIDYNVNVNYLIPEYNRSPLFFAMITHYPLDTPAKISNKDLQSSNITLKIIEELLMAGADPNLKDIFGHSFIDYFGHNKPIADILEKVRKYREQRKKLITENTGLVKEISSIIDSYL